MACALPGGIINPPPYGQLGETKFGFSVYERVKVIGKGGFQGWHGHVRTFERKLVAVDLDEPPAGFQPNGQWFLPQDLVKAPK